MIGRPKFKEGDKVKFTITMDGEEHEFKGKIFITDAYGTFYQNDDVSYDIMVKNKMFPGGCLFKHIEEAYVKKA